jgi:hypothetical protein
MSKSQNRSLEIWKKYDTSTIQQMHTMKNLIDNEADEISVFEFKRMMISGLVVWLKWKNTCFVNTKYLVQTIVPPPQKRIMVRMTDMKEDMYKHV